MNNFDVSKLEWTREPADFSISAGRITITTNPHTDLWQRTYYRFRNDSAPVLQMETEETYFSFTVKTEFESKHRFDQCGIVMYLDSENWLKASIEYENEDFQHLFKVDSVFRALHAVIVLPAAEPIPHGFYGSVDLCCRPI